MEFCQDWWRQHTTGLLPTAQNTQNRKKHYIVSDLQSVDMMQTMMGAVFMACWICHLEKDRRDSHFL